MGISRFSLPFALLLAAPSVYAAGGAPVKPRLVHARAMLQAVSRAAAAEAWQPSRADRAVVRLSPESLSLQLAAEPVPASGELSNVPAQPKPAAKSSGVKGLPAYKTILSSLVITRDLSIPGTDSVGVRLIPTSNALAGESAAIVFRPRLIGTSWVGMDIAARF
jgi:hypothetical protein